MPKFTRVSLDSVLRADADGRPIFRRCYEHEVLMAFFDDAGCHAFKEWWDSVGAEEFGDHCSAKPELRWLTD